MIGIINYGVGNIQSVKNSLSRLDIDNIIINKPGDMDKCDKIILPGVGAFGAAMDKLNSLGFAKKIHEFADKKKPILGICLGMQLLFDESSEHGHHKGLGLIKGKVLPFSEKVKNLPLPQIGWNNLSPITHITYQDNILIANHDNRSGFRDIEDIDEGSTFYFVNSFYCDPDRKDKDVIAYSEYGIEFPAIVKKENSKIYGCQFHPEKSQSAGLQILKNFNDLC
jgi:glutamine amidotransferase